MFTSRAEHRLILRQDNADERLSALGYSIGLLPEYLFNVYLKKSELVNTIFEQVEKISVRPEEANNFLVENDSAPIRQKTKLYSIVSRPNISFKDFLGKNPFFKSKLEPIPNEIFDEVIEAVEVRIKYAGYITRENSIADKIKRLESIKIENKFDYPTILSLSTEARQKLERINPSTIGQAGRIPGISPNDINVLLILLGR
jgi:tRNA uridine 5-carboxymethylaminomethyl modification enzyme